MAPASVQVVCMEPVVFLRGQSASGEDARGRRRQIDFDAPPSQLRGLVTLSLPRPSRIKEIYITLQGKARTDWPEGIGPNRLDTVEESIVFKQKVTLYNAREQAPARRPRSSSIGPGVDYQNDDLAWPSTSPAFSAGNNAAHQSAPSSHTTSPSASFSASVGRTDKHFTPKLPKSFGKTAAKAGAAILPLGGVGRNHVASSQANGTTSRPSSASSQRHSPTFLGNRSSQNNSLTPTASTSPSNPHESYFDPPPNYKDGAASTSEASTATSSTTTSNIARSSPHPQSVSAAGPGQRSILQSSLTRSPQTSEQRTRARGEQTPNGLPNHVVRFDPEAVSNALQRQETHSSGGQSSTASTSPQDSTTATNVRSTSEPSSRRTSIEQSPNSSRFSSAATSYTSDAINTSTLGANQKGKGKASANGTLPVTPPIPAAARRGIKTLLGGLRKEDEHERQALRSPPAAADTSASSHGTGLLDDQLDWREFPKGTHSYPFSVPLPSNLPPTLHADFGSNAYSIKVHVHRAGPLTANLSAETEVTLVHAPDEGGQDDIESIVVERNWEDALRYMVVVMGKSFPVGGRIPIWAKFVPMEKIRIHRIVATLEERTAYYAKGRRIARHEVPRRWTLLKILPPSSTSNASGADKKALQQGILPILSEDPNALLESPLAPMAKAAALSYSDVTFDEGQRDIVEATAIASLADPTGPWEITMELETPMCHTTRINISSNHVKSNIAVHHVVKLAIRVERLDGYNGVDPQSVPDNKRKLYDILIEAPISINHSHTANAWLTLPSYWSVPATDAAATTDQESSAASLAAFSNGQGQMQIQPHRTFNTIDSPSSLSPSATSSSRNTASVSAAKVGTSIIRPKSADASRRSKAATVEDSGQTMTSPSSSAFASSSMARQISLSNVVGGSSAKEKEIETRNARLAQISKRWLSLTGAAFGGSNNNSSSGSSSSNGNSNGSGTAASTSASSATPQSAYQATVTYAGNFGEAEQIGSSGGGTTGLPTYEQIDLEGGSVDPPPSRQIPRKVR